MNLNDISTQLLYCTVPIWVETTEGKMSSGTSFFLSVPAPGGDKGVSIPFLVTNYHVVKNAKRVAIELAKRRSDLPIKGEKLQASLDPNLALAFIFKDEDLALIPIGALLNNLEAKGEAVFYRSVDPSIFPDEAQISELSAIEEITFIGYPSGMYDSHNVSPLMRRGITATPVWNDFMGKKEFLVDAGVYPGSSGSPVFILNQGSYSTSKGLHVGSRILFLGVMSQSVLRTEADLPAVYLGIGKVIKAEGVLKRAREVTSKIVNNS